MKLEIFRNNEQINIITSTEEKEIYKHIAQCYRAKDTKRATVKIIYTFSGIEKITETFKPSETTNGNTYKYIYYFEGVQI
jgi:hypothetical protein